MSSHLVKTAGLCGLLFSSTVFATDLELSGNYKNILIRSSTLPTNAESTGYFLDTNRLRLRVNGELTQFMYIDFQYDNTVQYGDYLKTNQFEIQKNIQPDVEWDLDQTYLDTEQIYATQRLYRSFVVFSLPDVDIHIGRQRIAWGTATLWNPMDILNPFNPVQLERQERQGIDAVLADWNYGSLSRLSFVYVKQRSGDSRALRWHSNFFGVDISAILGDFRNNAVAGVDFASQIGDVGVRGEITITDDDAGENFMQSVFGADYTFINSLSINAEFYYNGQGSGDKSKYDFGRLLSGTVSSLGRSYIGAYLGYDVTPLLVSKNYFIINMSDNSTFVSPTLQYSMTDNIEGAIGIQYFAGEDNSEYGFLENLYYVQVQWFF